MKTSQLILTLVLASTMNIAIVSTSLAGNLPSVTQFNSGDTATASGVNAVHNAIRAEIDDNANDIALIDGASFIQILPTDFLPSLSGANSPHVIGRDWLNGVFKLATETDAVYAAIKLPHGSTITSFSCILDDGDAVDDPQVVFFRQLWAGGPQEVITTVNTSGANSAINTEYVGALDATLTTVDLDGYFYYLYGTFGNVNGTSVMIRRCKIGYTYNRI